ncbi:glycosyltransferase [Flavobacterium qiangtangense]|uniref:Glycosyltransferase n=1 Tax=Flavobacterium qiangtangense TaxID=1442595 RepID=A0ABW1PQY6_9FLAO
MKPLVSIIIPCYNHSRFIKEALDSIVADTYPNKEIVIIDDGSKDDSVPVIKHWIDNNRDQNVKFTSRENNGFCKTLNELVDQSTGQYIVLLASDDVLINNTISDRVTILKERGKMVLVSDAEVINDSGELLFSSMLTGFHKAIKEKYYTSEGILDEIIFNFSISGAVVIMDRKIFNLIGKYPEDLKAEDLFFYLSSASLNQILFWDKVVSKYRIHSSNTSGVNPELTKTVIKTYKRLFFKIPGFKRKLKLVKRLLGIYYHRFKNNQSF